MTGAATNHHACHALGVCQNRTPACPDCRAAAPGRRMWVYGECTHDCEQGDACTCALQTAVQATRDCGCVVLLGEYDPPAAPTTRPGSAASRAAGRTTLESVAYWAAVGVGVGSTVAIAFGWLGFATARGMGL